MHRLALLLLLLPLAVACNDPVKLVWKLPLHAASVSTPLVTDSFIALGTEKGLVIAGHDGTTKCVFGQAGNVIGAPRTDGNLVYFGSTNYLVYAIRPNCAEVWSYNTNDRIKGDALVSDGVVYVGSYDGHLYALSASNGRELWTFPKREEVEISGTFEVAKDDTAPQDGEPDDPALVDADDGGESESATDEDEAEAAEEPPAPPQPIVGSFSYSAPGIYADTIFVGNLDHRLYAIDANTGTMLWRYKTDAPVTSSPLIVDGKVFFGSNDGNIYAIDSTTRHVLWRAKTQHWINSSALVDNGSLYIGGNDRHLYAYDVNTGVGKWTFTTVGPVVAIPAIYKNLVFAAGGSGDGAVYAIDRDRGKLFWRFGTKGKIESDPVVFGDKLFVSSSDGFLYAFEIKQTTSGG